MDLQDVNHTEPITIRIQRLKEINNDFEEKVKVLRRRRDCMQQDAARLHQSHRDFEALFKICCGIEVVDVNEKRIHIVFHPIYKGKERRAYTLMLDNSSGFWTAIYCDMPYSLPNISKELFSKRISSFPEIWSFIFLTWHQVILFVNRQEQFKDAEANFKELSIRVYPSIDTLKAMLHIDLSDGKDDDSPMTVKVHLKYDPQRALPEEITFAFKGASSEAEAECKRDLAVLQQLPLVDALRQAFVRNDDLTDSGENLRPYKLSDDESHVSEEEDVQHDRVMQSPSCIQSKLPKPKNKKSSPDKTQSLKPKNSANKSSGYKTRQIKEKNVQDDQRERINSVHKGIKAPKRNKGVEQRNTRLPSKRTRKH